MCRFFFYCNLNTEILEMCSIDAKQDIIMKSLSYTELDCVSVRWYVPHNNDKCISIKAKWKSIHLQTIYVTQNLYYKTTINRGQQKIDLLKGANNCRHYKHERTVAYH